MTSAKEKISHVLRRRSVPPPQPISSMSPKTKGFLQKFCCRQAAVVDMTQYGFINDSKSNPVNLLLRPLRERIKQICGASKTVQSKKKRNTPTKRPSGTWFTRSRGATAREIVRERGACTNKFTGKARVALNTPIRKLRRYKKRLSPGGGGCGGGGCGCGSGGACG